MRNASMGQWPLPAMRARDAGRQMTVQATDAVSGEPRTVRKFGTLQRPRAYAETTAENGDYPKPIRYCNQVPKNADLAPEYGTSYTCTTGDGVRITLFRDCNTYYSIVPSYHRRVS